MNVSKVSINPSTLKNSERPLSLKRRTKLREAILVEYIRSKPAGTPISTRALQAQLNFKTAQNAHRWIKTRVDRGLIGRDEVSPRRFSYFVPGDAKTTQPRLPISFRDPRLTKTPPSPGLVPAYKPKSPTHVEERARQFVWDKNSDSLREFVAWLADKER